MAASPLIAMAASRDLGSGSLDRAANRFADGFGVDDRFFVDRIRGCGLRGVSVDPIAAATFGQLDQLHRGGRDVEPYQGSFPTGR